MEPRMLVNGQAKIIAMLCLAALTAKGQLVLSKEQMIAFTPQNPYERFADGRPKVPDDLLEKVRGLVIEEAYGAASTKARDEWIKQKMGLRQYKSTDLYGTPKDPALKKEMEDYIKAHQKP